MKKMPFKWILPLTILALLLLSWQMMRRPLKDTVLPKEDPFGQVDPARSSAPPQPKPSGPSSSVSEVPSKLRLILRELRPSETKAGQVFNRQPNGEAAIVCMTENGTPSVAVLFNGENLETVFGDAGWVSAYVPKKFYQTPGEVKVSLLDQKTNAKSNELIFKVKP